MMIDTFLTRYIFCVLSTCLCLCVLQLYIYLIQGERTVGILIELRNRMLFNSIAIYTLMDVIAFNECNIKRISTLDSNEVWYLRTDVSNVHC